MAWKKWGGASMLLVGAVLSAGCGGEAGSRLPDDPEELFVYSIDGHTYLENGRKLTPEQEKGETLHGWPVLGKVAIADSAQRKAVVEAIKEAVRNPDPEARCFIPHHAIRSVKAGETVDLLICFSCLNYEGYRQ